MSAGATAYRCPGPLLARLADLDPRWARDIREAGGTIPPGRPFGRMLRTQHGCWTCVGLMDRCHGIAGDAGSPDRENLEARTASVVGDLVSHIYERHPG